MKKIILSILFISLAVFSFLSFDSRFNDSNIDVVVTTNHLGAIVNDLTRGTDIKVETLFQFGVDPHLYTLSFSDLNLIENSSLIIASGLHLEASMYEGLKNISDTKDVLFVGDLLPKSELIEVSPIEPRYDPHFWFDLNLLSYSLDAVSSKLIEKFPQFEDVILANTKTFKSDLLTLRSDIKSLEKSKVKYLITSHDAFSYLAREMDFELKTLIGVNTNSDFTQFELNQLKDFILKNDIDRVFAETTFDPKPLFKLQDLLSLQGYDVEIVSGLLGDSLLFGQSFFDFYRHNLKLIYG